MDHALQDVLRAPARQQPDWATDAAIPVREDLALRPSLVNGADVRTLRALLAEVAAGNATVIQAGDCAEDPAECTAREVARKVALLGVLADTMETCTRKPVLRVGRIAGQYAKPRSKPVERVRDLELPVYRGHMVNTPEPDPAGRRPDPTRMLRCYSAASDSMGHLGWRRPVGHSHVESPVWTSHEALLLDYELPLVRRDEHGDLLLSSTHWPWIGERTGQVDEAHVALLGKVVNPVACKVGRRSTPEELVRLCDRLNPERDAGRLTLIVRMGAGVVAQVLPGLVNAVRVSGHPVIWMVDPMHGNTVATPCGRKTRFVEMIIREVQAFQAAVRSSGGTAGGVHLETTPDRVTECVQAQAYIGAVGDSYTTLCDPRLNPAQAIDVVSAWTA